MNNLTVRDIAFILEGRFLCELGLARVWKHFSPDAPHPAGIISAYHPEEGNHAKDIEDTAKLRGDIESKGYGYYHLQGHWTDPTAGKTYDEVPFAVLGKPEDRDGSQLKADLKAWQGKYTQNSVIHHAPGEEHTTALFADGREKKMRTFHPDKIGTDYSSLRRDRGQVAGVDQKTPKGKTPQSSLRQFTFSDEPTKTGTPSNFKDFAKKYEELTFVFESAFWFDPYNVSPKGICDALSRHVYGSQLREGCDIGSREHPLDLGDGREAYKEWGHWLVRSPGRPNWVFECEPVISELERRFAR